MFDQDYLLQSFAMKRQRQRHQDLKTNYILVFVATDRSRYTWQNQIEMIVETEQRNARRRDDFIRSVHCEIVDNRISVRLAPK